MRHLLATASLHDGGGLFSLAWSLVVIPLSLAIIFNYRGTAKRMADRMNARMAARMQRDWPAPRSWPAPIPASPLAVRLFAGIFLVSGLVAISLAIGRFAHGGY